MFAGKCADVLLAIGPKAIPRLMLAVREAETKPRTRERLLELVKQLQAVPEHRTDEEVATLALAALFDGLRVRQVRVGRRVRELFSGLPEDDLGNRLVREAIVKSKQPAYCARLLEAAELVAHREEMNYFSDAVFLTQHRNRHVRAAAFRLLGSFRARR